MTAKGFFNAFKDVWILDGVRTPMVDYCGALGHISPTDLGIKVGREILKRTVPLSDVIWQSANLAGFLTGCFTGGL